MKLQSVAMVPKTTKNKNGPVSTFGTPLDCEEILSETNKFVPRQMRPTLIDSIAASVGIDADVDSALDPALPR